jgi:hypothetical protein
LDKRVIAKPKELIKGGQMSSEKEKELKKAEWCYCGIHKIRYLCSEGCPKCK